MSYVQENLMPGEVVKYQTTISYWAYAKYWGIASALIMGAWLLREYTGAPYWLPLLLLAGAGVFTALTKTLRSANELAITNQRVLIKTGWLWQKSAVLYLTRVEGVEVSQDITGRMWGYGTVQVRGVGTEVWPVDFTLNPLEFQRRVFSMIGRSNGGH